MSNPPEINTQSLLDFLTQLLNTPSPTGLAEPAIALTEGTLAAIRDLKLSRTRKGALVASWSGERDDGPRAVTAHVDTLGAMVREIKSNGRLKLTRIGGFAWNTVEGEGVNVFSSKGRQIRGSILLTKASGHIFGDEVNDLKREDGNIELRLDARTSSDRWFCALTPSGRQGLCGCRGGGGPGDHRGRSQTSPVNHPFHQQL